ncbi:MAG: thiamine phosphate synthase [Arcobacter sp.]|uniref:thiamine phosphate synthase n=1 Tax=Arcobacter sp. TaxID=1872629 RepID=UPI003B0011AE
MNLTRFEEVLAFNPKISSNNLYALCDFQTLKNRNISFEQFLELCLKFDAKVIQYRDKISTFETKKENLLYLKNKTNIPIIINDEIDLVEFCEGLHLGQEDFNKFYSSKELAVKLIRKKIGNKLLGLSTHNEKEILEANSLDLDMIGLGAYRATATKDVSVMLGEKISYLAKISNHPVCAIGGVKIAEEIKNISFNVVGSSLYE